MKRFAWLPLLVLVIGGCGTDGPTVLPMSKGMKKALEAKKPPTEESARAAGFKSLAEMQDTRKWLSGLSREITRLTAADKARIRELLTREDAPGPRTQAISAIARLSGPELQKEFLPDLRPLYTEIPDDKALKGVMGSWASRGGYYFLRDLEKDKDPKVAAAASLGVRQFDNTPSNMSGAG